MDDYYDSPITLYIRDIKFTKQVKEDMKMDAIKMTEEIPKIKEWLKQNNVDSICVDVICDDIVRVSLSKRANERLWTTQRMFDTFDIELGIVGDCLEDQAKVLNKEIEKEVLK